MNTQRLGFKTPMFWGVAAVIFKEGFERPVPASHEVLRIPEREPCAHEGRAFWHCSLSVSVDSQLSGCKLGTGPQPSFFASSGPLCESALNSTALCMAKQQHSRVGFLVLLRHTAVC